MSITFLVNILFKSDSYSPGIVTKPITFREFTVGVTPRVIAPLTSLLILSHAPLPKLRYNSISLRPPSKICVDRKLQVTEEPVITCPINMPEIGITYCGLYRGIGCMMKKKANVPTTIMVNRMMTKVMIGWC